MGCRMDFLEPPDGNVGVNLGRLQAGMSELLLDVADVGPVLQHEGGTGMPEDVAATGLSDPGSVDISGHERR